MSGVHYEGNMHSQQLVKQQLIQPAVVEQPQHFYYQQTIDNTTASINAYQQHIDVPQLVSDPPPVNLVHYDPSGLRQPVNYQETNPTDVLYANNTMMVDNNNMMIPTDRLQSPDNIMMNRPSTDHNLTIEKLWFLEQHPQYCVDLQLPIRAIPQQQYQYAIATDQLSNQVPVICPVHQASVEETPVYSIIYEDLIPKVTSDGQTSTVLDKYMAASYYPPAPLVTAETDLHPTSGVIKPPENAINSYYHFRLDQEFEKNNRPTRKELCDIVKNIGSSLITDDTVRVWFRNKRMKQKAASSGGTTSE